MNRIKARTKDGKAVVLKAVQHKTGTTEPYKESYPAEVKARALRMGLTLTGKRQGVAA